MKKTTSNSIKRNLTMTLSLMMTATMLASCGSGYDGSESRKSGSYNNERTTAENYRYSNVTAGDTDGTANISSFQTNRFPPFPQTLTRLPTQT